MTESAALPRFPALAARLVAPLPLQPLRLVVDRLVASIVARHPRLFVRLGAHAGKRVRIDPVDLPVVFDLDTTADAPSVAVIAREAADLRPRHVARISGPLAALVGMLNGRLDGDALFFSRDLVVEGDTEVVLALRNALDDAELDLVAEWLASLGRLGPLLAPLVGRLVPVAERLTGVPLARGGAGEHDGEVDAVA